MTVSVKSVIFSSKILCCCDCNINDHGSILVLLLNFSLRKQREPHLWSCHKSGYHSKFTVPRSIILNKLPRQFQNEPVKMSLGDIKQIIYRNTERWTPDKIRLTKFLTASKLSWNFRQTRAPAKLSFETNERGYSRSGKRRRKKFVEHRPLLSTKINRELRGNLVDTGCKLFVFD